ncbi:MAG TPA: helix-turn-helix domain-containing protein [Kofleriaceae bacterium]|nr:helix-turn-helix domain-containing protein [Kofleriaceae bacterium]
MARATALSADARRANIIAATIPLLRNHGPAVTTAQIAMAAGVAEGTLFRVFPDKESLIAAAICSAFDPAAAEGELARIDRSLGMRASLIAAVEILQRRVEGIWQLMSILSMTGPPPVDRARGTESFHQTIAELLEPHRHELRCDPVQAARLVRMMTFAGTHPRITDGPPLTAAEIVAVVLDGIRTRDETDPDGAGDDIEGEPAC